MVVQLVAMTLIWVIPSAFAVEPPPSTGCPDALSTSQISELKTVILAPFRTPYNRKKPHSLFNSNSDYHSSVHAHWALLSIARVIQDQGLRDEVLARLPIHDLRTELNQIAKSKHRTENPYRKAWLNLLLGELQLSAPLENWNDEQHELRLQIVEYLEDKNFPEQYRAKDRVKLDGAHHSWLLNLLLLELGTPADDPLRTRIVQLYPRLVDRVPKILELTHPPVSDFVYQPATLSALSQLDRLGASLPRFLIEFMRPEFKSAITPSNEHQVGMYVMQSWPYALATHHGDPGACQTLRTEMIRILGQTKLWRENEPVWHWIPQYIWMNYALANGMIDSWHSLNNP